MFANNLDCTDQVIDNTAPPFHPDALFVEEPGHGLHSFTSGRGILGIIPEMAANRCTEILEFSRLKL